MKVHSEALRVLAALLVAALNLRLAIAVVGPLMEDLRADIGMSSTLAGLLTTLPFVCMGAFAFAGPPVIRSLGTRSVLAWSLALIAGGSLARAVVGTPALLVVTTLPIGLGIALAGVAIPVVIKQYFPDRSGPVAGAYATSMTLGITIMGFTAVPLASVLGSWREAFAVSAIPALVAVPLWLASRAEDYRAGEPARGPFRLDRTGIYLGALFGVQSFSFAAIISWGPAALEDAGWSAEAASLIVSVPGVLAIAAAIGVPWLAERGDRRAWLVGMTVVLSAGLAGLAFTPGFAGIVWIVLFGFGSGAVLVLCFALPLALGETPARAGLLTAWMLGLGHLLAAVGPALVGVLRDVSGGYAVPLAVVFAISLADIALALALPAGGARGSSRSSRPSAA